MNSIKNIPYNPTPQQSPRDETINSDSTNYIHKKKIKKIIIMLILVLLVLGIIGALCVIFIPKKNSDQDKNQNNGNSSHLIPITSNELESRKLGSEFEFSTNKGDLKRIFVKQKYIEDRLIEGEKVITFLTRKTYYDIYIISEKNSTEEYKYFYDKIYECAISIHSECYSSTNDDCTPKSRVDLTNSARRNIEEKRNLEENNNLKDSPIPLCLFNLTNNDVITSISCPKSLSDFKKKMIILDLYFFRPPGIKRLKKENINSTITRKTVGDKKYIRETNGGICDIENAQFSFCTTDMNTTTDLSNTILAYDEIAVMNITIDEQNSYIKTKNTHLIDETDKVAIFNKNIYEQNLKKIINKLNPYFKNEVLFSKDDFNEVYIVSKDGMAAFKKMQKRKLYSSSEDNMIKKENNLLNIFTPNSGVTVDITLFNNAGINSDFMEADNKFYIENNKTEDISKSKESSRTFNQIIFDLITLSNAGNHLATKLYENTNMTLENMTEAINKAISSLNKLVKYKDLSDIFDSTLSFDTITELPYIIIQESTLLRENLEKILNNVENGGIKNNIKILNKNIYDYIEESRNIIIRLFNNLNELSTSLSSSKSQLTEISTYYLNHTSSSYISTIEKAKTILINYYKDEYNLISPQVDLIIKIFEEKMNESVEKEMKIIDNLYGKIENNNISIKQANENELKVILNNLYYSKNYMKEIIKKINEKIRNEMEIKANGYFISDYDLNSNHEQFSKTIEKASKISEQLDNDEFIDTIFDNVMKNIKRNFTQILKNMDKQKEELFPLNEDVLKTSNFSIRFLNELRDNITDIGVDISNKIKRENNYYLEAKQKTIEDFLKENKESLNKIVTELDNLFSVIRLEEIANLYENAFISSLEQIQNEIQNNKNLSDEYFGTLSDKNKLLELLKKYHVDEKHLPYCISRVPFHEVYLTRFQDTITSIAKCQGYLTKYNIYKDNYEKSKLYINNQLYPDLLLEYKNIMSKIRGILQVFKNNKMSNKYPDLNELSFIDDHIRIIDNFYDRLNLYISDDIFNNKYINLIKDYKKAQNEEINKMIEKTESYHKIINSYPMSNDYNYDLCLSFKRKKTYTCVNGVVSIYTNSDYYCLPIGSLSNNYLKLSVHSINSNELIKEFRSKFKDFNDSLSEKINNYTTKINELKQSLIDIEKETINQNITINYLSTIENIVQSTLSDKYGDEIIKSSYNYYQPNIKENLKSLLDEISLQWYQYFDDTKIDIENNLLNFKKSINELSNMLSFFLSVLTTNITNNYFKSIENHQKTEFNYTITYYYNILLKLVKSTHQYVISKLPLNPIGFNNIIEMRKKEINEVFNNIITNIKISENNALNFENQIYVIDVPETNFFEVNEILRNNILNTDTTLKEKLANIKKLRNNKFNDEISLSARFYLENSESGKQIEDLYEQIDQKVFVYLNLEKFNELLDENWIFDQDEFIKSLKTLLYNSDLEVKKELLTEKQKYITSLEEEITKTYTKNDIAKKINSAFKSEVKDLEISQINDIKQNVNDILNKIKEEFIEESQKLKEQSNSLNKNYTKIEERIQNYKINIISKIKENIFSAINEFNQNMVNKILNNYFITSLNNYISESETIIMKYGKIDLLSDSYNSGQIIHNIIRDLCDNYKTYIKNEIDSNYNDFYSNIYNTIDINAMETLIKDKIDEYSSILLEALKEVATNEIGIEGYFAYDLNNNIINSIDELVNIKLNNIKGIIETTKGEDFDINLRKWKKFDFNLVYQKIMNNCESLMSFIYAEKDNEKTNVDIFIKELMISNFNDLLQNIIPLFGNDFFERIIKYNENFKISSLYNTLKYCLTPTIAYYRSLQGSNNIKALTKDLKLKIYSLNDLDSIADKKNKEVLELLNKKVDQFIKESQEFLVTKYILFFINDVSIEKNFTGIVHQEIIDNIYSVEVNFKEDYLNIMNQYLKEKLIESYSKVMNKKTAEMILSVEEKRESLKAKIDDLFSLEPDTVLNDINNKINNTLDAINNFNSHFNKFKISENLPNFLNNFGKININPEFTRVIDILNYETKNGILKNVDKNSIDYIEYLNTEEFTKKSDTIYSEIKNKYIDNINKTIDNYGKEQYLDNLNKEINRQTEINKKKMGRLLNEEEIENIHKEKIADKAIDDTFYKLLTSSNNAKTIIYNLEKFDDFDKIINENINKLNIAYKQSLKRVKDNDYTEEVYNNLTLILSELKNRTLDYYSDIKNAFYTLKNYLQNSVYEINNDLNQCANITYTTFAEKYENLSIIQNINSTNDKNIKLISGSEIVNNQNKITMVNYTFSNIVQNAQFIFNIEFEEGEIKKPRVKGTIINRSKPGEVNFKFINAQENAGDIIEKMNAQLNNVNFTMDISFSTATKDIFVKTITDFDSYQYSQELIQLQENDIEKCDIEDGVYLCYTFFEYNEDNPKILSSKKYKTIDSKHIVEESIVHENNLFNLL